MAEFETNSKTSKEEQLPADEQLQGVEATANSISTISQKARRSQRALQITKQDGRWIRVKLYQGQSLEVQ